MGNFLIKTHAPRSYTQKGNVRSLLFLKKSASVRGNRVPPFRFEKLSQEVLLRGHAQNKS